MENGNNKNPLDGLPSLDIVVRLYPTVGRVTVQVPADLQGFAVMGLLEEAKMAYRDGFKEMQANSRIVVPAMGMGKIAS